MHTRYYLGAAVIGFSIGLATIAWWFGAGLKYPAKDPELTSTIVRLSRSSDYGKKYKQIDFRNRVEALIYEADCLRICERSVGLWGMLLMGSTGCAILTARVLLQYSRTSKQNPPSSGAPAASGKFGAGHGR
jgi:hypothetical protein